MIKEDIPACADILCRVYNNELSTRIFRKIGAIWKDISHYYEALI